MCDCIDALIKRFTEGHPTWEGRKVERVFFPNNSLNMGTGKSEYHLTLDVMVEGQKKPKSAAFRMKHCPLCGDKCV